MRDKRDDALVDRIREVLDRFEAEGRTPQGIGYVAAVAVNALREIRRIVG